jgi:hypothetical protein
MVIHKIGFWPHAFLFLSVYIFFVREANLVMDKRNVQGLDRIAALILDV